MRWPTARSAVVAAARSMFGVIQRDAALAQSSGFGQAWAIASWIPGWFGETEAAVFWSVMHEARPRTVVEIGSYLGRSTTLMGLALADMGTVGCRLVAIDPHSGDRQHLEGLGLRSLPSLELFRAHTTAAGIAELLDVRVATSAMVAHGWVDQVDFLFVDGWHSYEAVKQDTLGFGRHLGAAGLACFDDYGSYADVRRAAQEACEELGLTLYGTVLGQAWAGRSAVPPRCLRRPLLIDRIRVRLSTAAGVRHPLS